MSWHVVAHTSEVSNPGDFIVVPWMEGLEIAITNIDRHLVAFDNRCSHRGARIFREPRGNRPPVCAYHGRCAKVGQMQSYAVAACGGFIFASRSKVGMPDLDENLIGFLEPAAGMQLHSTLSFTMDCDWRTAIDNALDLEHIEHVHADSLAKLKLERIELLGYPNGSSIEAFRSGVKLDALATALKQPHRFDYVHAHLFPYACVSSTGGWTYSLQNYFPSAGRTLFMHRLYVQPGVPQWFSDAAAKLNEQVFREDAAICAGIAPDFKPQYGPRDDRIQHFRSRL